MGGVADGDRLMRVIDKGVTLDLDDEDPKAVFIREILKSRVEQPADNGLSPFWGACNERQRMLLLLVARAGQTTQSALARELAIEEQQVHGLALSLGRVGRRTGSHSPLGIAGAAKTGRLYFLDDTSANQVKELARDGLEKPARPRLLHVAPPESQMTSRQTPRRRMRHPVKATD